MTKAQQIARIDRAFSRALRCALRRGDDLIISGFWAKWRGPLQVKRRLLGRVQ